MRTSIVRSGVVLCALSGTIAACGAVVGIRDLEDEVPGGTASGSEDARAKDGAGGQDGQGQGGQDSATDARDARPPTVVVDANVDADADADAAVPTPTTVTVGGNAHFLQAGASLVLSNGAQDLTVTANGAFSFPAVDSGTGYAVTVKTSPADQRCVVQNGAGTANANVTNIDIRCSVVRTSRAAISTAKTLNSQTFVDLPDVAPLTIANDVAAKALVTLVVPVAHASHSMNFAISVDGTIVGEVTRMAVGPNIHATTLAVVSLTPGSHTIKPVWRIGSIPAPPGNAFATAYHDVLGTALTAVVLDSLPSFDRHATSALAAVAALPAGNNGGATPTSLGATPIDLALAAEQPALVSLVAPGARGDRFSLGTRVDNAPFSAQAIAADVNGSMTFSAANFGLANLTAGNHSIDAQWLRWADGRNTVTRDSSLGGSLDAVVFKSGVAHAEKRFVSENPPPNVPISTTFATVTPFGEAAPLSLSMNLARPSKVLVMFDACAVRPNPNWPQTAEAALFVNGTKAQSILVSTPNDIDWGLTGASFLDIVEVPAGAASFDVRFKLSTPSQTDRPPIVQVAIANATGWKTYGLGAIALE